MSDESSSHDHHDSDDDDDVTLPWCLSAAAAGRDDDLFINIHAMSHAQFSHINRKHLADDLEYFSKKMITFCSNRYDSCRLCVEQILLN